VPAGLTGLEHDDAGEMGRGQECVPYRNAEGECRDQRQRGDGRSGGGKTAPPSGGGEYERKKDAQLRLVGDEADEHAGEQRTAIEAHERSAETECANCKT